MRSNGCGREIRWTILSQERYNPNGERDRLKSKQQYFMRKKKTLDAVDAHGCVSVRRESEPLDCVNTLDGNGIWCRDPLVESQPPTVWRGRRIRRWLHGDSGRCGSFSYGRPYENVYTLRFDSPSESVTVWYVMCNYRLVWCWPRNRWDRDPARRLSGDSCTLKIHRNCYVFFFFFVEICKILQRRTSSQAFLQVFPSMIPNKWDHNVCLVSFSKWKKSELLYLIQ